MHLLYLFLLKYSKNFYSMNNENKEKNFKTYLKTTFHTHF